MRAREYMTIRLSPLTTITRDSQLGYCYHKQSIDNASHTATYDTAAYDNDNDNSYIA